MARASRSASISSKDSLGSSGSGSGSSDWSLGGSASREWVSEVMHFFSSFSSILVKEKI